MWFHKFGVRTLGGRRPCLTVRQQRPGWGEAMWLCAARVVCSCQLTAWWRVQPLHQQNKISRTRHRPLTTPLLFQPRPLLGSRTCLLVYTPSATHNTRHGQENTLSTDSCLFFRFYETVRYKKKKTLRNSVKRSSACLADNDLQSNRQQIPQKINISSVK